MDKHRNEHMCTIACKSCGTEKDETEFPLQQAKYNFRGTGKPARRKVCKDCVAIEARGRRATGYKPSGKVRKYPKEVRELVSACRMRCADAKTRAAKSGSEFDLDGDYLYELLLQQGIRCALSGIPLTTQKRSPHVMSLDQIHAGGGYVRGNVQWLSWAVNRAKGDLKLPEFVSMCKAIGRCNDYPEMEYTQVGGSALPA